MYYVMISSILSMLLMMGTDSQSTLLVPTVNGNSVAPVDQIAVNAAETKTGPTVIVYYFHRSARCPSCLAIEDQAAQVIESRFAEELAAGKLVWMPFNLDEPGGAELAKEYDLSVSTLLLARPCNGPEAEYQKLDKVWEYVDDPIRFESYVAGAIRKFMDE